MKHPVAGKSRRGRTRGAAGAPSPMSARVAVGLAMAVLVIAQGANLAFAGDIPPRPPAGLRIVTSKADIEWVGRIWDAAPHSAFTDLVRHGGRWFCVFREGQGHVSPDGAIRVLSSADGKSWSSAARLELAGYDLRDPKIVETPRGELMLLAGAAVREGSKPATENKSVVSFSIDGGTWGALRDVGERDMWLWRVTWKGDTAYGVAYGRRNTDGSRTERGLTRLYRSRDGVRYETLVPKLHDVDYPNETKILFLRDDTALCLMRRDGGSRSALLGRSRPPYTEWTWKDLGVYLGGPNCVRLADGRFLAAGRFLAGGAHTSLAWLDVEKGKLKEFLRLPSGGDTSYPGLVLHEDRLWMSYYSSHEGKTSIYVARVRLPEP